ncbi:MAG TPA: hypothetical protein VJU78_08910 [Chitinophagaceae bacterium]|nr:hypothetical protein [Chitinophagaceae bacterium]
MKKLKYQVLLFSAAILASVAGMAQVESHSAKPFKDLHLRETDPHFEQAIKKKELQKAPSLLYIDKTDSINKTNKNRRKKN